MLGLIFAPVGGSSAHVDAMVGKGMDWADRLTAKPLQRRDAWLSFFMQLFPAISWGLVAVVLPPEALSKTLQSLYYKVLPLLGVNRCITTEWRAMPERYQGLGLPDFVAISFVKKFQHL